MLTLFTLQDTMANFKSVGFSLVMLCMALLLALAGTNPTPTDLLDTTAVTKTASAALMPRGGTAENLPDNGHGPTPPGRHEPGGPYNYGDYCKILSPVTEEMSRLWGFSTFWQQY